MEAELRRRADFKRESILNSNIIRKFLCQIIKYLRSQIFIYCFVALIVEMNQWNLVMWLITDILPKAQPKANSY